MPLHWLALSTIFMSKAIKTLAIDPGTRHMGVALIEQGALVHYGVRTIEKGKTPHGTLHRARKAVLRLLQDFQPDKLILEKAFFARSRRTALLNVLVDEIHALAKRRGIRVCLVAPTTVKLAICGSGHATKEQVARAVCAQYPELKAYLDQNRKWKDKFHSNMFDAVALGIWAEEGHVAFF
jgi:crossover junction endodeoxyribonuclease RuvC